jgi:proteasome lid subunit RPN8/RPN11
MAERWVTTPRGRCIERDLGGGVVQRTYLSSESLIRDGGTCRLVDNTPRRIRGSATATTRTSADSSQSSRAPVFLPSLPPSYEAKIGFEAQQAIRKACRSTWLSCRDVPMHETGGWLLSDPRALDRVVVATTAGVDAEHGPDGMRLGSERLEAVRSLAPHLAVIGSWHLHPGDDGTPSVADREAWAGWRELDRVPFHIGLVATGGRTGGWIDPEFHAWLTTESFCEPLALRRL